VCINEWVLFELLCYDSYIDGCYYLDLSLFGSELFHEPGQNAYPRARAPVATETNLKITFSFQTLRCVFQRILNVILMVESGAGSRRMVLAITSAVISARNQAIKFIR